MAAALVLLSLLAAPALGLEAEPTPLQKVVTLIQDMKVQVEKEATDDEAAYEKYACWCTTNEKEKTAAIDEAKSAISDLVAFLEQGVAKEGQLKSEIESLEDDMAEDKDALEKASGLRAKEKSDFEAAEADMKETLAALKEAVSVLSEVQLLQKKADGRAQAPAEAQALVQVRSVLQKHLPRFQEVMRKDLFDVLGSLSELTGEAPRAPATAFLGDAQPVGAAAGAKSYNSRSGSILGMLSSMSDQFARDLGNLHKTEMAALVQFEKLRAAKLGEIAAATKQKKAKAAELAGLKDKMAKSKEEQASLEKAQEADETLLAGMQETCASEDAEYKKRVAVRSEEVRALGETLKILTEDDARTLFGKTMSFVQLASSSKHREILARATGRLEAVARRQGSAELAALAVRLRLDGFEKVKAAMDKMHAELKTQQKEEYEKNDFCKAELDKNEDKVKVAGQEKDDLDSKHLEVSNEIEAIEDALSKLKEDVAAMEVSLKEAGEARKEENAVFQTSIADQRATINILNKALTRLKQFYDAKGEASLVQVHAHAEPGAAAPPPPPTGKDYEKSAGAGGVLQLIVKIISDAESTEKEIELSEQKAQTDYAAMVSDTTASIEADRAAIAQKETEHTEAHGTKAETEQAQLEKKQEISKLGDLLAASHVECDWLLKYFDARQTARAEEMEAIMDAKAILSGSDFAAA